MLNDDRDQHQSFALRAGCPTSSGNRAEDLDARAILILRSIRPTRAAYAIASNCSQGVLRQSVRNLVHLDRHHAHRVRRAARFAWSCLRFSSTSSVRRTQEEWPTWA